MRIVADMVRGLDVVKASYMLKYSTKEASNKLEKLLYSAINNFEQKTGQNWEEAGLVISEIKVDGGRQLKRIQPAPQGRAHRIRKRSNHVTLVLSKSNNN
jgi:large subunit ribosomal protein L22